MRKRGHHCGAGDIGNHNRFSKRGGKKFQLFLRATTALVVVGGQAFASLGSVGAKLGDVLTHTAILVALAAIIAAVKALWTVAKPGD